jgi:hypothetical protein
MNSGVAGAPRGLMKASPILEKEDDPQQGRHDALHRMPRAPLRKSLRVDQQEEEEHQHQHRAGVDDDLRRGQEIGPEHDENTGGVE